MTSEAFVWIYLPEEAEPVVCGRVFETQDGGLSFVYGRSYRARDNAIPLSPEGMPLGEGIFGARRAGALPGPIRDAAPDAWARYAIEYRNGAPLGEIDLMLAGHGDRIGALAISESSDTYRPVPLPEVSLKDLEAAARGAQEGGRMPKHLIDALMHGTSIGGARPKATIWMEGGDWIAKFSSTADQIRVVRWEAAALELARAAGIDTMKESRLVSINGRDVLLVHRFDRVSGEKTTRRLMLSALTLLDLDETEARMASYADLAEVLLKHSRDAGLDRAQLFRRMVFNILIGNEDDHAKNHACFWDGEWLDLTPAYDIVPQRRVGVEGRQAMLVGDEGPASTLVNALTSAPRFGLSAKQAKKIIGEVRDTIAAKWEPAFAKLGIPEIEMDMLRDRIILSPVALAGS